MHVSLTIKKPNNKLNTNSKFFNENSKKVKSIHEQRELQLNSSNNNNKKNMSNKHLIMRKPRVMQNFYCVFMKIWDGIDFPGLS
jgi:hypothetical protein